MPTTTAPSDGIRYVAVINATARLVGDRVGIGHITTPTHKSHSHPSGDPSPTIDDLDVTRRLVAAGEILGIVVLDHIVVGDGCYFSFKEAGRL
jgi:hypothetical protein